jgi:hypothetical protein
MKWRCEECVWYRSPPRKGRLALNSVGDRMIDCRRDDEILQYMIAQNTKSAVASNAMPIASVYPRVLASVYLLTGMEEEGMRGYSSQPRSKLPFIFGFSFLPLPLQCRPPILLPLAATHRLFAMSMVASQD